MTIQHRIGIAFLSLIAAAGITLGAGWLGYQVARADPAYVISAAEAAPTAQVDAGSSAPVVAPIGSPLDELAALKAKYEALRAARSGGSKDLLWFAYAALAATVIRVLLAALAAWRGSASRTWAKWTALGLAVPLALLTYYAAGAGLWAAIVMAGAGPGAIVVNELLKRRPQ